MTDSWGVETITEEEHLVAELRSLGIRYLSRQTAQRAGSPRAPEALLADLVRQPSARVRAATIALLLAHPEYADAVPAALERLTPDERLNLRAFYLAAVLLEQEYQDRLRTLRSGRWQPLPLLAPIVADLNEPDTGTPRDRLAALGREHRLRGGRWVNWMGTYEQAARQLLRQWEEDVLFLLRKGVIQFEELERHFDAILPQARHVDIIPSKFQDYLDEVRRRWLEGTG